MKKLLRIIVIYIIVFCTNALANEDFFKDAIKLRKFDDAAKNIGVKIKDIIKYKDLLKASLK